MRWMLNQIQKIALKVGVGYLRKEDEGFILKEDSGKIIVE